VHGGDDDSDDAWLEELLGRRRFDDAEEQAWLEELLRRPCCSSSSSSLSPVQECSSAFSSSPLLPVQECSLASTSNSATSASAPSVSFSARQPWNQKRCPKDLAVLIKPKRVCPSCPQPSVSPSTTASSRTIPQFLSVLELTSTVPCRLLPMPSQDEIVREFLSSQSTRTCRGGST